MHNITIVPGEISTNFSSVDSIYYFKQIIHNLEFLLLQTSLCQILPRVLLPLDHAQLLQLSLLLCPVPSPVSTGSWCAEAALPSVFCSTRGNMTLLRTIEERENLFQMTSLCWNNANDDSTDRRQITSVCLVPPCQSCIIDVRQGFR